MNFFEGQYKSKPNISLTGSSKSKTKEELLKEAFLERKKREIEKRQLNSSIKIQSVFRSYLVRKRIKEQYRNEFDSILNNKNFQADSKTLAFLLNIFVKFFDSKFDKDRLIKLTNLIVKHKDLISKCIFENENAPVAFTLSKFLSIQLKCLNYPETGINQSSILRLIEYFTDSSTQLNKPNQNCSYIIFSNLIKNNYINELVNFSISKIPSSSKYVTSIPIAESIAQLFFRCFLYLKPLNDSIDEHNQQIVINLNEQLLEKSNIPQIKCVLLAMGKIISQSEIFKSKIFDFLSIYAQLIDKERTLSFKIEEVDFIKNILNNLYKLNSLLKLYSPLFTVLTGDQFNDLLIVIRSILAQIPIIPEDLNDEPMMTDEDGLDNSAILHEILQLFESAEFSDKILQTLKKLDQSKAKEFTLSISYVCHFIFFNANIRSHKSSLARKLALNQAFIISLWQTINSLKIKPQFSQEISLIQILASGNCPDIYHPYLFKLVAPLSTFCSLYYIFLIPIFDKEFIAGEAIFSKLDLIKMSSSLKEVCVSTVELMHPEIPSVCKTDSFTMQNKASRNQQTENKPPIEVVVKARCFTHLFLVCTTFLQKMHRRDIRYGFCPEDHWISNSKYVVSNRLSAILQSNDPSILTDIKFGQQSYIFQSESEAENRLSLSDIRSLTILQELPFTIPFAERVQVLENLILKEPIYGHDSAYKIRIRRDYLYEDAFDNLSIDNVPDLKSVRIVVEMVNQLGLEEAGIDGGGLFREFMLKLVETAFDPNRGFFALTSDGFLYPNPYVSDIHENSDAHYFFLGRVLAKAIQTKLLSPLKFAGFFLQKILTIEHALDIDYLASLDTEICKNLLSLKDYEYNVEDLELNFAIHSNGFGQTRLIELKPGGKDIPVTNENKIEYIFLLASYKLNTQIHEQTSAFRKGIANVINLDLLKLFNINEIQNLISGSNELIDVNDWKRYTVYSGVYNAENEVIKNFWRVVESFNEEQKRKLLKFATSRSRAPLFGFKNLIPNFAIHSSGGAERLPTASTCLNLLKLPPIEDFNLLREKLLCAIESDSGFDLS
ncbi:unnamed protein product [Brachionus calyciflorus]|uniref:HECT-type E3 ubiquitin transferase n=2 Tax=Brachionus calyciflorus TaxID=104777 RepID=A0A813NCV8_9BILA|nr:unnamed protein product [Brachionus calyciflorus]